MDEAIWICGFLELKIGLSVVVFHNYFSKKLFACAFKVYLQDNILIILKLACDKSYS